MGRDLFALPLRQRRTYMAVVQLLGDTSPPDNERPSTWPTPRFPDMVFDTDVAAFTGQRLASTRTDLIDLGDDLLIIEETGDGIRVLAKAQR